MRKEGATQSICLVTVGMLLQVTKGRPQQMNSSFITRSLGLWTRSWQRLIKLSKLSILKLTLPRHSQSSKTLHKAIRLFNHLPDPKASHINLTTKSQLDPSSYRQTLKTSIRTSFMKIMIHHRITLPWSMHLKTRTRSLYPPLRPKTFLKSPVKVKT